MKTSIGTLVMLNLKDLVLLKENSDYRYRGAKFNALKSSIKQKGVVDPISVGKLHNELHVADGNRRTTASIQLKLKEIPALVKSVENRDELQEMFMDHTKYTHNLGAVQLTDMYLKGMKPKYISPSVREAINTLNNIYGTTTRCNLILKRMVAINKSPRSYVVALENLENYIDTDDIKTNNFRKKALYWMLNLGSPWTITNCIKASAPVELLLDAINNKKEIQDDWWVNI